MKIEVHPYKPFLPENAETLILGSFPGKEQTQSPDLLHKWSYGTPRNQFWKIINAIYETDLQTKQEKQAFFASLKIGMTDIILKARRLNNTNLDENLDVVEWNEKALKKILKQYPDIKILCTGKYVEKRFRKFFPEHKNIFCLPSPSPRYARMSLNEKMEVYKKMLPKKND